MKAIVVLIVCVGVGVAGGLVYGLVLNPVTYTAVDPEDLAQRYKADYLHLIAADYAQVGDLPLAQQRLQRMGLSARQVAEEAERGLFERQPGAGALARLATDLGAGNTELAAALVTPSATPTAPPTATPTRTAAPSPTSTAAPTRTVRPSATPSQPPSATVPPVSPTTTAAPVATATTARPTQPLPPTEPPAPTAPLPPPEPTMPPPTATPATAFVVRGVRMLSIGENGGCEGLHNAFVTVLDAAGNPLNGVTVALQWDAGRDVKVTGHKPEFVGQAEFDLYGGYRIVVLSDANGQPVQSEQTRLITSHEPSNADLVAGGYCTDEADCNARRAKDPPQLCYGHYSWAVTFQRTY